MDYLLTYYDYDKNACFEWFNTEEEMREYIDDREGLYNVHMVIDMLYIKDYEDLKTTPWKSTKKKED